MSYFTKTLYKSAAMTFNKKLMRYGKPEAVITRWTSFLQAGDGEFGNAEKQEVGRPANNRVENSHLSFRRRERSMLRFRRIKTLQKFASVYANVHHHFKNERHLVDRTTFKRRELMG